jgi:hypothetical protein
MIVAANQRMMSGDESKKVSARGGNSARFMNDKFRNWQEQKEDAMMGRTWNCAWEKG